MMLMGTFVHFPNFDDKVTKNMFHFLLVNHHFVNWWNQSVILGPGGHVSCTVNLPSQSIPAFICPNFLTSLPCFEVVLLSY